MKKKEYKTGDIVKIDKKEMNVIETFTDEKARLDIMFAVISKRYHAAEKQFWGTIRDLYPEIKGFDLYINWEKEEIVLRRKLEETQC